MRTEDAKSLAESALDRPQRSSSPARATRHQSRFEGSKLKCKTVRITRHGRRPDADRDSAVQFAGGLRTIAKGLCKWPSS